MNDADHKKPGYGFAFFRWHGVAYPLQYDWFLSHPAGEQASCRQAFAALQATA